LNHKACLEQACITQLFYHANQEHKRWCKPKNKKLVKITRILKKTIDIYLADYTIAQHYLLARQRDRIDSLQACML
jgi:hypothetical protein